MKRRLIPSIIFPILILSACSAQPPQMTVTSPPPAATTIPTPTLNPQFVELQEQIAAADERFTLNPDGTISDGATPIKGVQVSGAGKVTITVDGEQVEIDPSIMNFDDEKGLSIEGFEDADGDGDYEPVEAGPSPEEIAADIAELNSEWNGVLTIDPETNQIVSKIGEGAPVEGMVYNPETGKMEMTRSDALGHDFTERFDPKLVVVSEDSTGATDETINYAFSLGENGQLERLKYEETSEYIYTQNEVLKMIAEDHSTAPGADTDTVPYLKEIMSNFWVKNPAGTTWYIKFGDFYEEVGSPGSSLFGTNKVKLWNNETKKEEIIRTSEYAGVGFGGKSSGDPSYAVVAWMDANNNPIIKIVRGKKGINNHRDGAWWGITE